MPLSLISAGIGLCFMTQLGRFSHMAKLPPQGLPGRSGQPISRSAVPQAEPARAGEAMPVETHTFLDTGADDDTGQKILA